MLIRHPLGASPRAIETAPDGTIWVGFRGDMGRLVLDEFGARYFVSLKDRMQPRVPVDKVLRVVADADTVYFLNTKGLLSWPLNDSAARLVQSPDWKTEPAPRLSYLPAFGESESGYLRGLSNAGGRIVVAKSSGGLFEVINQKLQLLPGTESQTFAGHNAVVSIVDFDSQSLLVTTSSNGLQLYDGQSIEQWSTPVFDIAKEHDGTGLARVSDDLFALSTATNGAVLFDRVGTVTWQLDRSRKWPQSINNDAARLPTGELIFPTVSPSDGMLVVSGLPTISGSTPPDADDDAESDRWLFAKPTIRRIELGNLMPLGKRFTVQQSDDPLRVSFALPDFVAKTIEFQSRIPQMNTKWSDWSTSTQHEYRDLPAGKLTFQIKARIDGHETGTESLEFEVVQHGFQRRSTWLILSAVLIVGLCLASVWIRKALSKIAEVSENSRELAQRLRFEALISQLSAEFVNVNVNVTGSDIDVLIDKALQQILAFVDAEGAGVFQFRPDMKYARFTHSYFRPGLHVYSAEEMAQRSERAMKDTPYKWVWGKAIRGENLAISDVHNPPAEAVHDCEMWKDDTTSRAILHVAMKSQDAVLGFIFLHMDHPHEWTDEFVSQMDVIAQIVGNAIRRVRDDELIRESEERFRVLTTNAPVGIFLNDPVGKCVYANEVTTRLIGLPFERIDDWRNQLHPEDRDRVLASWNQTVENCSQSEIEYRFKHADGTVCWVHGIVVPRLNPADEVVGWLGTLLDLTETKTATQQREEVLNELENRNSELERFTYTVSHDLKSPLITIKGFLGLLKREIGKGELEAAERRLGRISGAADQMSELLDELLELSRIGRLKNPSTPVPLGPLVAEVLEQLEARIAARHVEVIIAPDLPTVFGDRIRIAEVYQNLIENSVRFLGDQIEPRIEIGWKASSGDDASDSLENPPLFRSGSPKLFVRDNGIGIGPAYHDKVFGLFEQLNPSPEAGGTGIGLAIVRRIIEIHNGQIEIESAGDGSGTTFYFTFGGE